MIRRSQTRLEQGPKVHVLSQFAEMKFKPSQNKQTQRLEKKPKSNKQNQNQILTPLGPPSFESSDLLGKRLKYLFSLTHNHFLIGNENQLDLISITGITFGFIDTEYFWSLTIPGPILQVSIDKRKSYIALASEKAIHFYLYNPKKCHQNPKKLKQIQIQEKIYAMQFCKEATLALFYVDYFQIYTVEESEEILKKCRKNYRVPETLDLFSVPQAIDNVLNIFFSERNNDNSTCTLWILKVVFELIEIRVMPVLKIYDIKNSLMTHISIQNYSKDTFFINRGCEIIAAKKGFIIDSISINMQNKDSRLLYLSNERLLHLNDEIIEVYQIKIDTSVKPNRINIKPVDSIQIQQKPKNSNLFDVVNISLDSFAIFWQRKPQHNIYTRGQISYWFGLTQPISIEEKIKKIFSYGAEITTLPLEVIEAKCDMARKIGLQDKEIYLQIWNRSQKRTRDDYKFLMATRDFKIIHSQIQKKLKKESMSYRQIFKIFQGCLGLLRQTAFSDKCTEESLQQYLTCHLLVRKLKLFKELTLLERQRNPQGSRIDLLNSQEAEKRFMINIQQFYEYKNFDIKNFLIEHISLFCIDKKDTIVHIRIILRAFKFLFRVIYRQLLDEIIVAAKSSLLALLQAMPQLLPHAHFIDEEEQVTLFDGVWKDIKQSEWLNNLYVEGIKTVDNLEKVKDLVHSVWYKRYWLTTHDLIDKSRFEIQAIQQKNNSDQIFYYFIASAFERISDEKNLEVIIEFIENFYERMPAHLRGKVFLYHDLYLHYCKYASQAKRKKLKFAEFLQMQGSDLFRYFFDLEKVRKNSILRQVKPIYESCKGEYQGIDIFNEGLLQYFSSQKSQVSDLKYLLNRMNNQKSQFHENNISTYQVLVQAMQLKLKIGGQSDVPIEEVLIYIENIPLRRDNQVMTELQVVQRINEESRRFKQMRIDMSIREIIDNCEDVIAKLVEFQFCRNGVRTIRSLEEVRHVTYRILAQVQTVKEKIYGEELNNLPLFIYISQLLEDEEQIELAAQLLEDEYLNRYFTVNETITQNLVLYMYKKKFSQSAIFRNHQSYIRRLTGILPPSNSTRQFILHQLQFALQLSSLEEPIQFPISDTSAFPRVTQLIDIVKFLSGQFLLKVNIEKVYRDMAKMQELQTKGQWEGSQIKSTLESETVTLHQVYEIFISRLIELQIVQQSIPLIEKILTIKFPNKNYNTIYLAILLLRIAPQLNEECKHALFGLLAYCFNDQNKIISNLKFYMHSKITSLDKGTKLAGQLQIQKEGCLNYNPKNPLFKDSFNRLLKDEEFGGKAKKLIESTWLHLRNTKQEFKQPFFEVVFILICHQPYLLAKLIYILIGQINFKQLRSFLSYLTQEDIFDELRVLELARRVFYLVLHSLVEFKQLNHTLFNFAEIDLGQNIYLKEYHQLNDQIQIKLQRSVKGCERKSKMIKELSLSRRSHEKNDSQSIKIKIVHPQIVSESAPSEYPFEDSDDDYEEPMGPSRVIRRRRKQAKISFDVKSERNKFMRRDGRQLGKYMKNQPEEDNKQSTQELPSPSPFMKNKISLAPENIQNKVQRAMSLSYNPLLQKKTSIKLKTSPLLPGTKKMFDSIQIPKQRSFDAEDSKKTKKKSPRKNSNSQIQSSVLKEQSSCSGGNSNPKVSLLKREKSVVVNEAQEKIQILTEEVLQTYNAQKKSFNLEMLDKKREKIFKNMNDKERERQLFISMCKQIIKNLYENIYEQGAIRGIIKLQLIYALSKNYPELEMQPVCVAVYIQMLNLLEKYNLDIPLSKLLPLEGLYGKKGLDNLFELAKPLILEITTVENIIKLSKVVSLAFRKNIYEQQIAYLSLIKEVNNLQKEENLNLVEISLFGDTLRQLVSKLSTKMLKQKADSQFSQIDGGIVKEKLIETIIEVVKSKGDKTSVNYIKKKMNLA